MGDNNVLEKKYGKIWDASWTQGYVIVVILYAKVQNRGPYKEHLYILLKDNEFEVFTLFYSLEIFSHIKTFHARKKIMTSTTLNMGKIRPKSNVFKEWVILIEILENGISIFTWFSVINTYVPQLRHVK